MKKTIQLIPLIIISLILTVLTGTPSIGFTQSAKSINLDNPDLKNALIQLREARQAFKAAVIQEANERAQVNRERNQIRRQQAEKRQAEAQKRKEEHRKTVLLRLIEIMIKHTNNVKERVNRMPNIEASLKTQLNASLDATIEKLNNEKTKIEKATTSEELKELAKEVRDLFKSYQETVKQIVNAIHLSHATNIINKAENRAAAIQAKINELKASGKDTTALETELADAKQKIDNAKEALNKKDFQEVIQSLKDAYQKFRDIAEKAKNL